MADQQEVRDKRGWFQRGTAAGPGRPKRTDYAKIIRDALTPQTAFAIVEVAIEHAKGGDRHARAWVFSHVVAPVPKTLVLDDAAVSNRSTIDQAVGKLSAEQLATLQSVLTAMKETS